MNPETLPQLVQKGFRVALGATTSLMESLQDAQKRDENFSKLTQNPTEFAEELAAKGEVTEQEARNFVDSLLSQSGGVGGGDRTTVNTTATPVADPAVQADLQDLTAQLTALREELQRLQNNDSGN